MIAILGQLALTLAEGQGTAPQRDTQHHRPRRTWGKAPHQLDWVQQIGHHLRLTLRDLQARASAARDRLAASRRDAQPIKARPVTKRTRTQRRALVLVPVFKALARQCQRQATRYRQRHAWAFQEVALRAAQ